MDRRTASTTLALAPLAAALPVRAQGARTARVAWISPQRARPDSPFFASFRNGMRDAGWVEGRNLAIQQWWTEGTGEPLERALAEAVAARPDVIVAASGLVVRSLVAARVALPTVFVYSGDPVIGGAVESYARPGGSRTGVSLFSLELVPKRIELVKEMVPGMKRIAILGWPQHAGEPREREAAFAAAAKLGLQHDFYPVSTSADLEVAFDGIVRRRADAINVFADGVTIGYAELFADFTRRERIPAVSGWAQFAESGNVMTYGPVLQASFARLAFFVDRILKGTKPGELPVERPTIHELVINRRTAKEIGIAVPPTLLARADRIID